MKRSIINGLKRDRDRGKKPIAPPTTTSRKKTVFQVTNTFYNSVVCDSVCQNEDVKKLQETEEIYLYSLLLDAICVSVSVYVP